jgi:hypothetical protein
MTPLGGKGGNFKSCSRDEQLRIQLLSGWGKCLKVTLQTRTAENFRLRQLVAEWRVLRVQTRKRGPPLA